jgi:hypothetical protein
LQSGHLFKQGVGMPSPSPARQAETPGPPVLAAEIAGARRASMRSPDVAEGLAAHAQKREPKFGDQ